VKEINSAICQRLTTRGFSETDFIPYHGNKKILEVETSIRRVKMFTAVA
jgi:hypothetical protein